MWGLSVPICWKPVAVFKSVVVPKSLLWYWSSNIDNRKTSLMAGGFLLECLIYGTVIGQAPSLHVWILPLTSLPEPSWQALLADVDPKGNACSSHVSSVRYQFGVPCMSTGSSHWMQADAEAAPAIWAESWFLISVRYTELNFYAMDLPKISFFLFLLSCKKCCITSLCDSTCLDRRDCVLGS